jgi:hypothetical protein
MVPVEIPGVPWLCDDAPSTMAGPDQRRHPEQGCAVSMAPVRSSHWPSVAHEGVGIAPGTPSAQGVSGG